MPGLSTASSNLASPRTSAGLAGSLASGALGDVFGAARYTSGIPRKNTRPAESSSIEAVYDSRQFAQDVERGLSCTLKSIPSRWLYDAEGSRLFSEITRLPEYDLTRKESEILHASAASIAIHMRGSSWRVVELGAGDGTKTEILLSAFQEAGVYVEYCPVDVSEFALNALSERMRLRHPAIKCRPLIGDNLEALSKLSDSRANGAHEFRIMLLDLGSSIGNRSREEVDKISLAVRCRLHSGDMNLTGFDLVRDTRRLIAAYDDKQGVTREFNLNLLRRMNRELGADFHLGAFKHEATWNPAIQGMESWLVSLFDQRITIAALGKSFYFRKWEPMRTEISLKFDPAGIRALARRSGYESLAQYSDPSHEFMTSLWRAEAKSY